MALQRLSYINVVTEATATMSTQNCVLSSTELGSKCDTYNEVHPIYGLYCNIIVIPPAASTNK